MASDDLAQLVATNREKGGRHSPLYPWLRARHDTLAAAIEADGASWPTIAASLAKVGLTDGTGKPPTPERARKCWHQVKKDVAAARENADPSASHSSQCLSLQRPPLPARCEASRPIDRPPDTSPLSAGHGWR